MMYWFGSDMGTWMYVLMATTALGFWALAITGILLLVRSTGRTGQRTDWTGRQPSPDELLAERFARGEIDETEYADRLATLRAHRTGS